ncbi:hypothetical protein ACNKHK_18160 [Shigella flexneri]
MSASDYRCVGRGGERIPPLQQSITAGAQKKRRRSFILYSHLLSDTRLAPRAVCGSRQPFMAEWAVKTIIEKFAEHLPR